MGDLTIAQAAKAMNVSVRGVYLARELQRCSRPDLEARCMAGDLTIRQALRLAKPEKYGKRDKVEQWLAQYLAWSGADRLLAYMALQEAAGE
jgi:hypothetical protein